MNTRGLLLAALLTATLAACGGDDADTDPPEAATSEGPAVMAEAAASLDLSCEFEPNQDPDAVGLGTATVLGENTSDVRIDSLDVTMTLSGSAGEVQTTTNVAHLMPGEELAQRTPVFEEYDGEVTGDCTVASVTGTEDSGGPLEIDPEAAVCEVTGEPGGWELVADLVNVQGVPYDIDKAVGVIAEVDGTRVATYEDELTAGETELRARVTTLEEEPTCSVRYLRDRNSDRTGGQ